MNISDVRATLYLLIQAVENDLRSFVKQLLLPQCEGLAFLHSPELTEKVLNRFRGEYPGLDPTTNRMDLVDFMDFPDAFEVLTGNSPHLTLDARREFKTRAAEFQKLIQIRNRVMHGRPLMAGDLSTVLSFVQDASHMGSLHWSACVSTLAQLTDDPAFACGMTVPVSEVPDAPCHNLPMPDFDDTGFIGRLSDVTEVKRLLLSRNSVITLLGEGGIGKTALLLKVLYDIVDMGSKCPFDYIVWVSSKTSVLTSAGIETIRNAVADFDGVVSAIGDEFGNLNTDPVSRQTEIIEAVRDVPTLIVLDNLETIVGDDVREFVRTIQEYAKIIITSRVGLGELEYRRQVGPLREIEAETLLRQLARLTNAQVLYELPSKKALGFIRQLHCNPLSIRWFVHGVASGRSPGEVLGNKDTLLDYCMSNVYGQLSDEERSALQSMLSARRPLSEAEITFFTNIEPLSVRRALNGLLATSFVTRAFSRKQDSEECLYDVVPLARDFLVRRYPPSKTAVETIAKKRRELTGSFAQNVAAEARDPYSVNVITVRNTGEQVAARTLQRVLTLSRKGQPSEALSLAEDVVRGHSNYFEGYRICAFVRALQGNLLGANEDYRKAVELEPSNPRLLYFYAGFLLRFLDDPTEALKYAKRAMDAAPESPTTRNIFATCLGYTGQHSKAIEMLTHILNSENAELTAKHKRVMLTQIIDFYRRIAETALSVERDGSKACTAVHHGMGVAREAIAQNMIDQKLLEKIATLMHEHLHTLRRLDSPEEWQQYDRYLCEFKTVLSRSTLSSVFYPASGGPSSAVNLTPDPNADFILGTVSEYHDYRDFAFIQTPKGDRYFFHKSFVANPNEWDCICDGVLVEFKLGRNNRGVCAVSVRCAHL